MQKLTFVPREPRENHLVCKCNAVLLHTARSANVLRQPAFNQSHLSFKLTIDSKAVWQWISCVIQVVGFDDQMLPQTEVLAQALGLVRLIEVHIYQISEKVRLRFQDKGWLECLITSACSFKLSEFTFHHCNQNAPFLVSPQPSTFRSVSASSKNHMQLALADFRVACCSVTCFLTHVGFPRDIPSALHFCSVQVLRIANMHSV